MPAEVLHFDLPLLVLLYLLFGLNVGSQQVVDLFVVDFDKGTTHQELSVLGGLYYIDDVGEGTGYDALELLLLGVAHHRKGLSTS